MRNEIGNIEKNGLIGNIENVVIRRGITMIVFAIIIPIMFSIALLSNVIDFIIKNKEMSGNKLMSTTIDACKCSWN
jgi:hypothetical protein